MLGWLTAAQGSSTIMFDIPEQRADLALTEFAQQAGISVLFPFDVISQVTANRLVGEYGVEEGLEKLLEGTGLTTTIEEKRQFVVHIADSSVARKEPETGGTRVDIGTRGRGGLAAIFGAILGGTSGAQGVQAQQVAESVEQITVTGTRLRASGFDAPTPVTVIDEEAIARRAPANIADIINEAPAFLASRGESIRTTTVLPPATQNLLNLRGLGESRTLTLINDHRAVGTNWQGTVDTNIVPVGLVERIEVVTGGASAAYGSDAVAGVANIILRNKMQGFTANVQGGLTEYESGTQYTASLAGGTEFADRGNVILGVDYNETNPIKDVYGKTWGANEIGTVTPSAAQRISLGLPASYISNNVEPGTSAPGGLYQQSPTAAYTFDASGNPVPFDQGMVSGAFMIGTNGNYGYNTGNVAWLRADTSRLNTYGRMSFDVTDRLTPFLELSYTQNEIGYRLGSIIVGAGGGTSSGALTVARANPYVTPATLALLPGAATTFTLGRIMTEMDDALSQSSDVYRIVAGVDGSVGDVWTWEVYVQSGRTNLDHHAFTLMAPALQKGVNGCTDTTTGLTAAQREDIATYETLSGKTCVGFNPFGVDRNSESAVGYFTHPIMQEQTLEQDVIAASTSGSPFRVPAGNVSIAAGIETRREDVEVVSDPVSAVGNLLVTNLVQFTGGYRVNEGFLEAGIPVLADRSLARSLDLNVAARHTDYELSGSVTTWKAGFTWQPVDPIRVRFTRSRDIRAPNIFEIFLIGGTGPSAVINRIPNGVTGRDGTVNVNPLGTANTISNAIRFIGSGGGPNLKPEIGDTTTAGIVFQRGGFVASLDYYNVELDGAIVRPSNQAVVDMCRDGNQFMCEKILFDSTVPGGIRILEANNLNLNTLTVSGWDFETAYQRPMPFGISGNLTVRALLNYAPENTTYEPLTRVTTENANTLGAQPEFAGLIAVGWEGNRVDVNVQFRGFGERRGNPILDGSPNTVLGPEDAGYNPANNNTVNKNRFAGRVYVNPSLEVRVNDNISVFANIDNLFDEQPTGLTTNSAYDLIGRRYRLGMRARFD
jgi:iron complex outermembrane recepter protein